MYRIRLNLLSSLSEFLHQFDPFFEEVDFCLQSCWVLGLCFSQTFQGLFQGTNSLGIILKLINFNLSVW